MRIIASGDLDEWKILELLQAGAAIDTFGVGTALGGGTGSAERGFEGGALGAAYKTVWYVDDDGTEHPAMKTAGAKSTWPGKKEIFRHPHWEADVIQLVHEPHPEHYQRLLRPVMHNGQMLPVQYRALETPQPYPVRYSEGLQALREQAMYLVGKTMT